MFRPGLAVRCALAAMTLILLTDCQSAVRRRFYATCGDSADCETGLCSQGLCTRSCATSDECGVGVCIEKVCKPIDRVACKANADCEKASPSNGCRTAVCAAGKCAFAAPLAGVVCGTRCEAGAWIPGQCTEGKCIAAKNPVPVTCDDNNSCTEDACTAATGCTYANRTAPCDDGDACTASDACSSGACKPGAPVVCSDNNVCTADSCDNNKGCLYTPTVGPCDDGDPCTAADKCGGGKCQDYVAAVCDDGNSCTFDNCEKGKGCASAPTSGACDDGDPCTMGDGCTAGKCVAGAPNACADSNPCTDDLCEKSKGCVNLPNKATCDDGNGCTVADSCAATVCAGQAKSCDDGNPCTDNTCNKASGCLNAVVTAPCDDGNACTMGDICKNGNCNGTPVECNDKLGCTADSCDNVKGGCQHQPDDAACATNNPCAVGSCDLTKGCTTITAANGSLCLKADPCSLANQCQAGLCTSVSPKKCEDGNPCTVDSCDSSKGCTFEPALAGNCDDGNPCTKGDTCLAGICTTTGPGAQCDDTNPCTEDKCDPGKGCVSTPSNASCDDGDPCSSNDNCSSGKCTGTTALWSVKPTVGAPYQAEGVAVSGSEIGFVGSTAISADYVKRHVAVVDAGGNVKWQAPVNASGLDRPNGIVGINGKWFVCGEVKAAAGAVSTGFVGELGPGGAPGWQKSVQGGTSGVTLRNITFSGTTLCAIGRVGEGAAAKTMVARYTQSGGDLGNTQHAIEDNSEGFAVAGYSAGQGFAFAGRSTKGVDNKALVGRLTEGGQLQWTKTTIEVNASFGEFRAVALAGTDIVAAGELVFSGTAQVYVARYDQNGNKLWAKVLTPFNGESHATGIAVNGGWTVVAAWGVFVGQDVGLALLDSVGNLHNTAKSALPGDQKAFGLAHFGDGTFVLHGTTSGDAQPVDISLARTNAYLASGCGNGNQCAQLTNNVCDDGNPCTEDSCVPSNGCEFKVFADTTPCATGKTCKTGACLP